VYVPVDRWRRIAQVRAPPVDEGVMEATIHTLSAAMDDHTASVTCGACAYAFISSVNGRGIDLTRRIWLDRGDRSATHSYLASMDEIASRATRDR
jgi:hypothetical protein